MGFPVFSATPALAASNSVLAPANGAVVTRGSQVTAKAHYDATIQMQLRVKGPGGDDFLAQSTSLFGGDLSGPISLNRNGRYTVYLKGTITNHTYDSNTFTVRIPPAAPSGLSATVSGGKVKVSWNLGLEDDLSGYVVGASGAGSKSGSVGSFCSGTSCSATLSTSSSSVKVSLRAKRPTGTGGTVSSGVVSTTVAGGGSGGNGSGGPSGGGGNVTLPPSISGGGTTTPLTPFNNDSPVTLPSVQPSGAVAGFTYPTPQVADSAPKADNVAATDSLQWSKSVGIALVLLVVAGHLGTWTRRLRVQQAGVSRKGMAARMASNGSGRKRVSNARKNIAKAEAVARTAPIAAAAGTAKDKDKDKAKSAEGGKSKAGKGGKDGRTAAFERVEPVNVAKAPKAPEGLDAPEVPAPSEDTTGVLSPAAGKQAPKRRPARLGKSDARKKPAARSLDADSASALAQASAGSEDVEKVRNTENPDTKGRHKGRRSK
ncbi:hypothetical protein [Actinomadura parmotrematis]|uniref:Uncharacterized protein n=1 Tax=Actinomadura parmotrematis TaxID=2864039 RepID=A0ABS7FTP2_9ACTN|nr:hypothetical protein [Actinomadura parmotrematis]MBW8482918.1 hypothetical protein [Actinomadura parmotrematis]